MLYCHLNGGSVTLLNIICPVDSALIWLLIDGSKHRVVHLIHVSEMALLVCCSLQRAAAPSLHLLQNYTLCFN